MSDRVVGGRVGPLESGRATCTFLPAPPEAALALAGAWTAWEALTPGRRRGLLHEVEVAKTAPTLAKRVAALVAGARA